MAAQRSPDSFLGGGAALHIEPNSLRYSNDLDYFQDSAARVASAYDADRRVLVGAGFEVETTIERNGFVRAVVRKGEGATKVDWLHDTAWRFLPAIADDVAGYRLHPVDLAINKVLALVGRDEPRDFLDTLYVHEKTLCLGAMVWAGAGKDPGFTPPMLLGMLRRRGRLHPEDLRRLVLTATPDLVDLKERWLAALDDAQAFVESRPPNELGCLYYSRTEAGFPRDPSGSPDPGGDPSCPRPVSPR
jgi:hypothetical protein